MQCFRHLCDPRLSLRSLPSAVPTIQRRSFYPARGQFVTLDPNGRPATVETHVRVGERIERYVHIQPAIGDAIKDAIIRRKGIFPGEAKDIECLPMQFHHLTRCFYHSETLPYPRVQISRDLARLGETNGDVTPATLWLTGKWHTLSLVGSIEDQVLRQMMEDPKHIREAMEKAEKLEES